MIKCISSLKNDLIRDNGEATCHYILLLLDSDKHPIVRKWRPTTYRWSMTLKERIIECLLNVWNQNDNGFL